MPKKAANIRTPRRDGALALAVALGLFLHSQRVLRAAEERLDYKYEIYSEERDRILIRTHSALFETKIAPRTTLRGAYVYDGISGATPDGGPSPNGGESVRLVEIEDVRHAGYVESSFTWGAHTFRPQLAFSTENDYDSIAPSLNYLFDFNQKNTTLNLGAAHNFDTLTRGLYLGRGERKKDSTDLLLGLTQVLTPTTLLNATFTLGFADGYLSDPYKGFRFTGYPVPSALFPERRPSQRTKEILSTSVTQFFEEVRGSAEVTYRFYHDSFGLTGHTFTFEWFQNFGRRVVLAPMFRCYEQSAADFYRLSSVGDPSDRDQPDNVFIPRHYSSDYRLSQMRSITYGLSAMVRLHKHLDLDLAYKRYEMKGLDGVTARGNYPKANIYTVGFRLQF